MIIEKITEIFTKELAKAVLKYIFLKDGKFSPKRALGLSIWCVSALFVYWLPRWLPGLLASPVTSQLLQVELISSHIHKLSDANYFQLAKLFYLSIYTIVSLLAAIIVLAARQQALAVLSQDDQNILLFVREVKLLNWYRCSEEEERNEAVHKIAEKIESSKRTRIMVINGYHDIAQSDSIIHKALVKKGRNLHLQVLLLDPFSSYAANRAAQLKQETDVALTKLRYIRDHVRVLEALDQFRKRAASVEYRIYCSNPFFRIYLFDHDLIFQTYQANRHGNETPLYNFVEGERSLFNAGKEIFDYYWNKGFLHDENWLKRMGPALTVYLASMYGLHTSEDIKVSIDEMRKQILEFVSIQKSEVDRLDSEGRITDLDH